MSILLSIIHCSFVCLSTRVRRNEDAIKYCSLYHKKLSLLNDNYKLSNAIEYCVYFFGIVSDLLPVLFILKILNYVTLDSYFSDSGHSGRHIWLYRYCCKCCGYCKSIVLYFYCTLPVVINTWKKIYRMMNKCVECCFCGKIYTPSIVKRKGFQK